jgi:hypothetical protein
MLKRITNLKNVVLLVLLGIALTTSLISLILNVVNGVETTAAWWVAWLQNMSTEMLGALLTFVLIERIVGGRDKQQQEKEEVQREKARLIRQLGSRINSEAIRASEELRGHQWLEDGSLKNQSLLYANLENVVLSQANLQDVNLFFSNLKGAYLDYANLQGASLIEADLSNALLPEVNLQDSKLNNADFRSAYMESVNLQNSRLWKTNLKAAFLANAEMQGAEIDNSLFDERTTLPDGSNWTPDADLSRFTDPTHRDFWRSNNPDSPAYRGITSE